jgi:hypothetical protein
MVKIGLFLLAAGCGAGGITESCDFRTGQSLCEEYQHSNGILKQGCGQAGGRYSAGPCDHSGTVGACRHDPTAPDPTVIFDYHYAPETTADVMGACKGTFLSP